MALTPPCASREPMRKRRRSISPSRVIPHVWAERLDGTLLPTGTIQLAKDAGPVTGLPGYDEGAWWVQDAAAALPARLLGDVAGKRIADLCAAPGGKTAQLAAAGAEVVAVDSSAARLRRMAENMRRLSLALRISSKPTFSPGSRSEPSTQSCSMRPARPPARSAAIPTFPM